MSKELYPVAAFWQQVHLRLQGRPRAGGYGGKTDHARFFIYKNKMYMIEWSALDTRERMCEGMETYPRGGGKR